MRAKFELSHDEQQKFRRLQPYQGEALAFWATVARSRGLDPKSVLSDAPSFSGLALGHGKHWCFPAPIECKKKPVYKE